jgi:hypothetical protein
MTSHRNATTPAKAGAQLGNDLLADAARGYYGRLDWAPASAGVVASGMLHIGVKHQGGRES